MCKYINDLKELKYKKNKIDEIAKKHNLSKSELTRYYNIRFFKDVAERINLEDLSKINVNEIEKTINNINDSDLIQEFRFIKSDLNKIISKSLYIAISNGFSNNIKNIESGVMTANAGDSAEFIFIARAILAGFNCSSVDVRSSRYDAIIDRDGYLLRVQIKGISSGNSISFKDRDRGGQGIDHTHERNIGKRITSKDCDIYVAVDKQVGLCYIIPMSWVDTLEDSSIKSINLNTLCKYKENWNVIELVANEHMK